MISEFLFLIRLFLYQFAHRTENSPWPGWTGVMHGDEIAYVFGDPLRSSSPVSYTDHETQLSKQMMTHWTNFAKTG